MTEKIEQHVYQHYDPREPEMNLEVNYTTRGLTWKVEIKGAVSPEQALELYERTASGLGDLLKQAEKEQGDGEGKAE